MTEQGRTVEGVTLKVLSKEGEEGRIVPEKNDDPLEGITTYDLVLISRHILGLEPLDSPYKMIAADANKSKSITTFDLVELRKLILGIYKELPDNKSWRFVQKSFSFENANDPFQTNFYEHEYCIEPSTTEVEFIAIKVGDVNNSANTNQRPTQRPITHLSWPNLNQQQGGIITVPIIYTGSEPLEAIQLGMRFDPAKLQLIGPSQGDLESYLPGNFNLHHSAQGEIRTMWLPMTTPSEKILPGTVLFHLSFKVLDDSAESELPLWLDEQLLPASAWAFDGIEYALRAARTNTLRIEAHVGSSTLRASVHPNATTGASTSLLVQADRSEKARVMLFDAFARGLGLREFSLIGGPQELSLPELEGLPNGVYLWKVFTQTQQAQGHIIKQ